MTTTLAIQSANAHPAGELKSNTLFTPADGAEPISVVGLLPARPTLGI